MSESGVKQATGHQPQGCGSEAKGRPGALVDVPTL